MNWKEKIGKGKYVFNESVDEYLLSEGFYYDTMSPRFMNDESCFGNIRNLHKRCLRLDTSCPENEGFTIRVFINRSEAYKEVQDNIGSYSSSNHMIYNTSFYAIDIIDYRLDMLLK